MASFVENINKLAGIADDIPQLVEDLPEVLANLDEITTVSDNINDVVIVANNINDVNEVSLNISSVVTVANDLNEPVSEIEVVANNICILDIIGSDLNGSCISEIQDNGSVTEDVTQGDCTGSILETVAENIDNVNIVANNIEDVILAGTNIADIQTVADEVAKVIVVADDLNEAVSEIEVVANNIDSVNTVGLNVDSINTVSTNIDSVNTVAGISSDVSIVSGINEAVSAVSLISDDVTTVAGVSADITTVADIASDVTFLAINWNDKQDYNEHLTGINQELDTNADVIFDTLTVDSIKLAGGTGDEGTLTWNDSDRTLNLEQGGVSLQLGQEMHMMVRNSSGSTIGNGTFLGFSGVTVGSNRVMVAPFNAGTMNANHLVGFATEDISNGINGFATTFGYVRELDTRGTYASNMAVGDEDWSVGDILYPHPTVAGKLTNVEPTTGFKASVAVVTNRHQSSGEIFVRVTAINENGYVPMTGDFSLDLGSL